MNKLPPLTTDGFSNKTVNISHKGMSNAVYIDNIPFHI